MNKIEAGKINPEIKPVQTLENKALEEIINNILSPLPEETAEEYLYRVEGDLQREWARFALSVLLPVSGSEEFKQKFLEVYNDVSILIFRDKKLKEKFSEVINNLSTNQKRQSEKKDQKVLSKLDSFIREAAIDIPGNHISELEKQDFFRKIPQERKFFKQFDDKFPYIFMMFGLSDSFMKGDELENYIHSLVDNKIIFLFGGGDSIKDLLDSENYKPKKIINFDPYLKQESIGKRRNIDYESRMISASDTRIKDLVAAGELPKADEIWATYSVPYYLNASEDIASLFQNIASLLNEGGSARIFPLSFKGVS